MTTDKAPSGQQWELRAHDQELTVVQVGGGIRRYRTGGHDALFGYPAQRKADAGRGQLLMPWPNRVRDGKFSFGGRDEQLALSEPARHNATHGLVRWANWSLVEQHRDHLVVGYSLMPQQGWDWMLELEVSYRLLPDGLEVTPSARNVGAEPAPFGFGAHPYLTTGESAVDELTLQLPAATVLDLDDQLIPVGTSPVPEHLDFRSLRTIGDTQLDHAFTDLAGSAHWGVTVTGRERRTTLWAESAAFPFVQAFTGDSLPDGAARHTGLAVEPMTCPANALASGDHLVTLAPGDRWSGTWGVRQETLS